MTAHQGAIDRARAKALAFVRAEAGFAQVTTIGRRGYPVGRTTSAFLANDWSVELIQRRTHHRVTQLLHDPAASITWVGTPANGAANDCPAVFDLGLLVPRAVFVQGDAESLSEQQTWDGYSTHTAVLLAAGNNRAPARTRANVAEELTGFCVHPRRVRLEGFGEAAQTFDWDCQSTTSRDDKAKS